jgi:hypothetical protein
VIDQDHTAAGIAQPAEQPRQVLALALGHSGGRLVEQQEHRIGRQHARQSGAARLAVDRRLEGAANTGSARPRAPPVARSSRASIMMKPESARSRPLMTLSSVVLPEPLGPISPTISPRSSLNETSTSASTPPKRLLTRRAPALRTRAPA